MSDLNGADRGGTVYADWIADLAAAEIVRKERLEARGLAVIAASGTLVTLLFALSALATKPTDYKLPEDARDFLYIALVLFALSAALAIFTNVPLRYRNVADASLRMVMTDDYWAETETDARRRVAATRVNILLWNRKVNTVKALLLVGAVALQVAAVVFVSLAVWQVLEEAPTA